METRIVISIYRVLKGMTPEQLAAKMYVTVDEVIRWENGENGFGRVVEYRSRQRQWVRRRMVS